MKLSTFSEHIQRAAEEKGISVLETLKRAAAMGYTGIDIMYSADLNMEEFTGWVREAGLEFSSICVRSEFGEDPDDFSVAYDGLRWCEKLGMKKYLCIPGMIDLEDAEHAERQKENMVKGLNRLCKEAGERGIMVLMEDYDGAESPYRNLAGLCYFMENVPELRFAYDSGNFDYSDEDELVPFDTLISRISHVHLKDRGEKPLADDEEPQISMGKRTIFSSPFGYGYIRSKTVMEKVKAIGYDGFMTVEFFRSSRPYEAMEMSAEWILGWMKENL